MKKETLFLLLLSLSVTAIAQVDRAIFQTISPGGITGSFHGGTSAPTHFSSVGQTVQPRPATTGQGGGVLNTNEIMFTAVVDATPATIANIGPTKSVVSTAANITAQLTDVESGIFIAKIRYRPIAASASIGFTTAVMSVTTGSTYQATIPATLLTDLGVEYKIQVANGFGLLNTDSLTLRTLRVDHASGLDVTSYPSSAAGVEFSNYRIIALPLVSSANKANDIFGDELEAYDKTKWRLYKYNGSSFAELDGNSQLTPGEGYWMIAKSFSNALNTGEGTTVDVSSKNPFQMTLRPGWNQIGNPYPFNISWADILAANTTASSSINNNRNILVFRDGTKSEGVNVLRKMEGGFVKNTGSANVTIDIPVVKNTVIQSGRMMDEPNGNKNSLDQPSWEISFNLQAGDQIESRGGIGMHPEAQLGFDQRDDFTLPRFLEYLELRVPKKHAGMQLTKDVVPTQENFAWEFTVESNMADRNTTLSWDNSYFGSDKNIYLLEEETHLITDMREKSFFNFGRATSGKFKVIFGTQEFAKEQLIPSRVILYDPYPNPFVTKVIIEYSLPEVATQKQGSIKIYNALGQEVHSMNTSLQPGTATCTWENEKETTGIYLVRLTIGDQTVVKKIIKQ